MPKQILLITGGAGFVGYNVISVLKNDYNIICLDKKDNIKNLKKEFIKGAELVEGEVSDEKLLDILVRKTDKVLHLAGGGGNAKASEYPMWALKTHVLATEKLLEKCKKYKIKKFVFASTASIYDGNSKSLVDEKTISNPQNFYSLLKKMAEDLIIKSKIDYIIFRFANIYGENHLGKIPENGAIYKFVRSGLRNIPIEIHDDDSQKLNYIHIDDVVGLIKKSLDSKKVGIYNVASKNSYQIIQLVNTVKNIFEKDFKKTVQIKKIKNGSILKNPEISIKKVKKDFIFDEKVTIEDGIKRLIAAILKEK